MSAFGPKWTLIGGDQRRDYCPANHYKEKKQAGNFKSHTPVRGWGTSQVKKMTGINDFDIHCLQLFLLAAITSEAFVWTIS